MKIHKPGSRAENMRVSDARDPRDPREVQKIVRVQSFGFKKASDPV